MRRGVEHDLRTVFLEYVAHFILFANVRNQGKQMQIRMFAFEFLLDFIGIIFIRIEDNKRFGVMCCNLTANFTTDRTAAARYEHDFFLDIAQDLVQINAHLIPT